MLETKIEALTLAIEALAARIDRLAHVLPATEALNTPQSSVKAPQDVKKDKPIKTPCPPEKAPQDAIQETAISAASVKALAKEKMAAGVIDNSGVKAFITQLGADSIVDLTAEQLFELTTLLEEL